MAGSQMALAPGASPPPSPGQWPWEVTEASGRFPAELFILPTLVLLAFVAVHVYRGQKGDAERRDKNAHVPLAAEGSGGFAQPPVSAQPSVPGHPPVTAHPPVPAHPPVTAHPPVPAQPPKVASRGLVFDQGLSTPQRDLDFDVATTPRSAEKLHGNDWLDKTKPVTTRSLGAQQTRPVASRGLASRGLDGGGPKVVVFCCNDDESAAADKKARELESKYPEQVVVVKPQAVDLVKVVHARGTNIRDGSFKRDRSPERVKVEKEKELKVLDTQEDENGVTMFRVDAGALNASGEEAWLPEKHMNIKRQQEELVCERLSAKTVKVVHPRGAGVRGDCLQRGSSPTKSDGSPTKSERGKVGCGTLFDYVEQKTENGMRYFKVPADQAGTAEDGWIPEWYRGSKTGEVSRVCEVVGEVGLAPWADVETVLSIGKIALVKLVTRDGSIDGAMDQATSEDGAYASAQFVQLSSLEETLSPFVQ